MKHIMTLQKEPFQSIMNGTKSIELRLNDEKRQQVSIGDQIVFKLINSDAEISVRVKGLYREKSFMELLSKVPLCACGFSQEFDAWTATESMRKYYSGEEEQKYGVLGIELIVDSDKR